MYQPNGPSPEGYGKEEEVKRNVEVEKMEQKDERAVRAWYDEPIDEKTLEEMVEALDFEEEQRRIRCHYEKRKRETRQAVIQFSRFIFVQILTRYIKTRRLEALIAVGSAKEVSVINSMRGLKIPQLQKLCRANHLMVSGRKRFPFENSAAIITDNQVPNPDSSSACSVSISTGVQGLVPVVSDLVLRLYIDSILQ